MGKYCVEYVVRVWVDAENKDDARKIANGITNQYNDFGIEFDYPEVEKI